MVMSSLFHRRHAREEQLAHFLRAVPLFRELPVADLVAIWRRLAEVRLPAGAVVFQRGDLGDKFYVIQAGAVEVCLGLGPSAIPLRRLEAGDFFGEVALLTSMPRTADVVVVEDAVLWELDRGDFDSLVSSSIPLLKALNNALCDRVALLTLSLEKSGSGGIKGLSGMRFGPYRVVEQIGIGGMAAVYSAVHVTTETAAAVKVLPMSWGAAPEFKERLGREAEVLKRLIHSNVIKVLEVGEVEERLGGGCYLAMEWLPHALDRVLRAQYPEPLESATALRIAVGVAEGLGAVHDAGLVHRDVKPSNILLRADGSPVLTDFGLAVALAEVARGRRLTPTNVIVGTADYLSPEQIAGGMVDGRADIYSLGVVLYEMLSGYVPFAGRDPMDTLKAHLEEPPPALPEDVPIGARAIVDKALKKRPEERFPSAAEMKVALDETIK